MRRQRASVVAVFLCLLLCGCAVIGEGLYTTGTGLRVAGQWMGAEGANVARDLGEGASSVGDMLGGPVGAALKIAGGLLVAMAGGAGVISARNSETGKFFGPVMKKKKKEKDDEEMA